MNEQNSTIPIWDGDPWHWRIPTNISHQTERLRTRWHSPQTIHHRPRKASCWTSIHTTQALSKELWSPMSSNVPSSAAEHRHEAIQATQTKLKCHKPLPSKCCPSTMTSYIFTSKKRWPSSHSGHFWFDGVSNLERAPFWTDLHQEF